MLRQLAVHNIVLVERLELEFEPGLGVLTGETGAGKSILLDALGLALGARADTALVRAGEDFGVGLGRDRAFGRSSGARRCWPNRASTSSPASRDRPADAEERRRQPRLHRWRGVPAGLLRDVGALAVEIHGQHDDRGLLNPKGHRALLDAFGKLELEPVEDAWAEVTRIEAELLEARTAPPPPSATANGSNMHRPRSRRWPPRRARKRASPRSARRCRRGSRPENR